MRTCSPDLFLHVSGISVFSRSSADTNYMDSCTISSSLLPTSSSSREISTTESSHMIATLLLLLLSKSLLVLWLQSQVHHPSAHCELSSPMSLLVSKALMLKDLIRKKKDGRLGKLSLPWLYYLVTQDMSRLTDLNVSFSAAAESMLSYYCPRATRARRSLSCKGRKKKHHACAHRKLQARVRSLVRSLLVFIAMDSFWVLWWIVSSEKNANFLDTIHSFPNRPQLGIKLLSLPLHVSIHLSIQLSPLPGHWHVQSQSPPPLLACFYTTFLLQHYHLL